MNKKELIESIAEGTGLNKTTSEKVLNGTLDAITGSLKEGSAVTLVGFGSFSISKRNGRKGRNPQSGKEIDIPEKMVVRFKTGKPLNDSVNNN